MIRPVFALTLRSLLMQKRTIVLGLVAAAPVLMALIYALARSPGSHDHSFYSDLVQQLFVPTVASLVALVFGVSAFGDEPGEAVEHVVERKKGVGDRDALGGGVRDVALVPEGDVLEPDQRLRAHHPRQPADPLGDHGVPLVRHRRRALLAAAERLLHFPDLGAGEVADLECERVERRGDDRE